MQDWMINAGVLLAGLAAAWGGARTMLADLKETLSAMSESMKDVSDRLVHVEAAFKASEALRLDERLRALERDVARLESSHGSASN